MRGEQEHDFPKYFVAHPPEHDNLTPVYYKITGSNGPVFWRHEGDDRGREVGFFDLLMEEQNGFGLVKVSEDSTPWSDD